MADEAHRTQYDVLAANMRRGLPNAAFLAVTGTPLMAGEEKTREVFGDYVSVYNFQQSVADRATVPLYYENRIPELQLTNENLNEDMERLLEEAELDEQQERKLERQFAREYHLITRDDRLEKIAEDLVQHFIGRGYQGKAMVISIDRMTAVRMYDKVQKYWQREIDRLRDELHDLADTDQVERRAQLQDLIRYMEETDMAVVVSSSQGEVADFREKGLDIVPHRRRMVNEDLETKFKDPDDPFRIVFVCAMWITGFDVPVCSTIYLDKPMRNHTLMQAIARANRVFDEKNNGLIVDYVGVFRDLQRALAIYGSDAGGVEEGELPVKDKAALLEELAAAIGEAREFCEAHGVDLGTIEPAEGFERIALINDAVDAIIVNDEAKRRYLTLAATVDQLYRAILPDTAAEAFGPPRKVLVVIAQRIRSLMPEADISGVMGEVEALLDRSVAADPYVIPEEPTDELPGVAETDDDGRIDLSRINFEALRKRFESGHKRIQAERLRGVLSRKLRAMVRLNRSRMDYLARFQQMIDEYNAGAANVDVFFTQLMAFARELSAEDQRHIAEQLSEEELAIFDLLTKPEIELTDEEVETVKEVAGELLKTLKREKLVLDWRKRQQSRAAVQVTIERVLDRLPRAYSLELYEQKCDLVYQHVFESYHGADRSIYAAVA